MGRHCRCWWFSTRSSARSRVLLPCCHNSHFNVCKRSKVPRLGLFVPVCSSFTDSWLPLWFNALQCLTYVKIWTKWPSYISWHNFKMQCLRKKNCDSHFAEMCSCTLDCQIVVSACLFIWHFCHPVYLLVLFRINFTKQWAVRTTHINSKVNQLPFFSNISQILLLCKTWGYYNKFDSMKALGIYKVDVTDVSKYYNAGIWSMD